MGRKKAAQLPATIKTWRTGDGRAIVTTWWGVDEADGIARITQWVRRVAAKMATERAQEAMRDMIEDMLDQGVLSVMRVIEMAENGLGPADAALRKRAVEMFDRGEMPGAALLAYVQKALVRKEREEADPAAYAPLVPASNVWLRNVFVAVLVTEIVAFWHLHLPATRNPASKKLSACYLLSDAMARAGFPIGERQVERIHRDHYAFAAELSARMAAS